MHNLIIDNIKLNDNTDDHFEELHRKQHNIFEQNENNKNNDYFGDFNNEQSLEQKNKDLDRKLISLYRLHSSKFHKQKDIKLKDDLLNMRLNLLKKEDIEKINSKNNNSVNRLRQKMAFKFRFVNNIDNKISSKKKIKNYKKQNEKMNKILKISKSIPDVLYKEIKTMKTNNNNKKINNKKSINNVKNIENNSNHGFSSSFKTHRYLGNIYDYYKSNIPLYIKNNILNNNNNNINNKYLFNIEELSHKNEDKDIYKSNKQDKVYKNIDEVNVNDIYKYKKNKIDRVNLGKQKGDSLIKLSSLLS